MTKRSLREFALAFLEVEETLGMTETPIPIRDYLKACRAAEKTILARGKTGDSILKTSFVLEVYKEFVGHFANMSEQKWKTASWDEFDEVYYSGPLERLVNGEDGWILGALIWDSRLPHFGPTIGWLLMNGFRSQAGAAVLYPLEDEAVEIVAAIQTVEGGDGSSMLEFMSWYGKKVEEELNSNNVD